MNSLRVVPALSSILIGLALLFATTARLATAAAVDRFVTVNGSGSTCSQASPCSLQTAISLSADGDTIHVAGGVYTGTAFAVIAPSTSVTLQGGWDGSAVGTVVRNPRVYTTTLDGENQRRGVYFNGDISVTLDGFRVTRGLAVEGAGIAAYASGLMTVRDCVIVSNTATGGWGGGVQVDSGNLDFEHNVVMSNVTPYEGGGLAAAFDSRLTIKNNLFVGNSAGVSGGGIRLRDIQATLINNTIARNTADGVHATSEYTTSLTVITLTNNIIVLNAYGLRVGVQNSGVTPTVAMAHNDVWNNATANYAGVTNPTGSDGNLSVNPRFVSGADEGYYLSQVASGQANTSAAVDAGSGSALSLGLGARTTRSDRFPDIGIVDMGYHYPAVTLRELFMPVILRLP